MSERRLRKSPGKIGAVEVVRKENYCSRMEAMKTTLKPTNKVMAQPSSNAQKSTSKGKKPGEQDAAFNTSRAHATLANLRVSRMSG